MLSPLLDRVKLSQVLGASAGGGGMDVLGCENTLSVPLLPPKLPTEGLWPL